MTPPSRSRQTPGNAAQIAEQLAAEVATAPLERLPDIIGALAAAQARAMVRLTQPSGAPQATPGGLVGVDVLAAELDVKVTWLRAQARAGKLPHTRCGKYIKFDRAEVMAALAGDHKMERLGTAEKPNTGAGVIPERFHIRARRQHAPNTPAPNRIRGVTDAN